MAMSGAALTVLVLTGMSEIEEIASAWNDLVFGTTSRPPMLSFAWVASFLEMRPSAEARWMCLAAFADGRLVGVLPLAIEEDRVFGRGVTILRQPGGVHAPSADLVAAPGYEAAVAAKFRDALDDVAPGWFGLEFMRLEESSILVHPMMGMPRSRVVRSPGGEAAVVKTVGKWEDYHKGLSSNFRRQLKRARNKAADQGELRSEFLSGAQAVPEQLEIFMAVEAAGWKGRIGSAIRENEELVRFYRRLTERLHACGALEWHFLRIGGEVAAGHLAARSGRTLSIWKIGFNETYAQCSPGVLLIERLLKRSFADETIDEVNYVTDREWHRVWQPEKRPYYDVRLYPKRPLPYLTGVLPGSARQALRRVPGLRRAVVAVREWRQAAGWTAPGGNGRGSGKAE